MSRRKRGKKERRKGRREGGGDTEKRGRKRGAREIKEKRHVECELGRDEVMKRGHETRKDGGHEGRGDMKEGARKYPQKFFNFQIRELKAQNLCPPA